MEFQELNNALLSHFKEMVKNKKYLFSVAVDKDELWNTYLDSFPAKANPIYKERRQHDCSCCRHFIKTMGNVVVIQNNQMTTIWDCKVKNSVYQTVFDALSALVKSHPVSNIFISKSEKVGTSENYQILANGTIKKWNHFYFELPEQFVNKTNRSIEDIKGTFRDTKHVFQRSLDEISEDSLLTVLELIDSNTLYRGQEWKKALTDFLNYKKNYQKLTTEKEKNLFLWEASAKTGIAIGRIRNHSIGALLIHISEGMDLDTAVRKYEQIVAPTNYKRPKAIFTKQMLEDAKNTLMELGYLDSLNRRYATLDDITINNILFSNKDAAKRIYGTEDIFEELERDVVLNPKKFSRVEEIPIEKFISDILPTANEIEIYFENKHRSNMVSLIAPEKKDSKTMFKWNNNFGWAYSGNLTDSMKERVKAAGGRVDGVLRFSIQWNESGTDNSDLDAHCIEPNQHEIFFKTDKKPKVSALGGQLDVDIIQPGHAIAVENITWLNKDKMLPGKYQFFVHQYTDRGNQDGFRAEIEFDGQIHSFDYKKGMRTGENVSVADVLLKEDGTFQIKNHLSSTTSSIEIWHLHTNQFIPVSVIMYSPNYWDEQNGIGHRHYFFMLKDCINTEQPNGFYNEFLKPELIQHKRVLEALGSKMRVQDVEEQLSGLGFSSTKREELVVKVKGNTERILKIKF